ncbi:MAG: hypothetical protein M1835_002836 [Candelina submexicana]|nr:MAG: hypothetical protein M1835_002836 [Candelina submexicana]
MSTRSATATMTQTPTEVETGVTPHGHSTSNVGCPPSTSLFGGPIVVETSSCSVESSMEHSPETPECLPRTYDPYGTTDESATSGTDSTTDISDVSSIDAKPPAKTIGLPPPADWNPTLTGIPAELRNKIYEYVLIIPGKVLPKKPTELNWRKKHRANCPINNHPSFRDKAVKGDEIGDVISSSDGMICRDRFTGEDQWIPTPQSVLALLLVCRQIFNEASPVFYRKNHFVFDTKNGMYPLGEFLTGIGSRAPFITEISFVMSSPNAREVIRQLYDCKYLRKVHIILDVQYGTLLPTLKPNIEGSGNLRTFRGVADLKILKGLDVVEFWGKDRSWQFSDGFILDINDGPAAGPWLRKHMIKDRPEWYLSESELRRLELEEKAKEDEKKRLREAVRQAKEEAKRKEQAAFDALPKPGEVWQLEWPEEETNKAREPTRAKGKGRAKKDNLARLNTVASESTRGEMTKTPKGSKAQTAGALSRGNVVQPIEKLKATVDNSKEVTLPTVPSVEAGPRSGVNDSSNVQSRGRHPDQALYKPKKHRAPLQPNNGSTQQTVGAPDAGDPAWPTTEGNNNSKGNVTANGATMNGVTTSGVVTSAAATSSKATDSKDAGGVGWNNAEAKGWKSAYNNTRFDKIRVRRA